MLGHDHIQLVGDAIHQSLATSPLAYIQTLQTLQQTYRLVAGKWCGEAHGLLNSFAYLSTIRRKAPAAMLSLHIII